MTARTSQPTMDNGPGMDEGKPSVGGSIFAKFGVANAKTMQNNGQVLEEPLHPAVEQAPGSIPVAILRQLKKVEELPQANKTKVTERCVRTTLKMFRKAELEKAMKGDSAMIVRLREKVANVLMPKMLMQAQIEVETVRGKLASLTSEYME